MAWYFAENGQPNGPLTEEELGARVHSGHLTPDSLLWREGMAEWLPLKSLFQLPPAQASARVSQPNPPLPEPDFRPEAFAPPPGGTSQTATPTLTFAFTGTWHGYYRVWILGMLLTVLTLGFYAPWAKVRNRRYLYGHTRLGDDAFDYRADPRRLLVGQLLVAALVAFWFSSSLIHSWLPPILLGVGALFLPWIITRSLRFKARSTVWRGLRFDFRGDAFGFLWSFAVLPLLSLGIFWPAAARARRRWLTNRHRFGATSFDYDSSLLGLYAIYLKGLLFFVPAGICYAGVGLKAYLLREAAQSADGFVNLPIPYWIFNLVVLGPNLLPFMIPVALGGLDFLSSQLFTHHWNGTSIGQHQIQAYMDPKEVFKLRLLHTCALLCSFGLLWPWVKIRNHEFKISCIDVAPSTDLSDLVAAPKPVGGHGALGESLTDFLDLDIGL